MTYEIYRYIFIGSAILSVVMLTLAIVLFFKLKISKAIADLSGSTRKKALKEKQEHSLNSPTTTSGSLIPKVTTAQITPSGNLIPGTAHIEKRTVSQTNKLVTDEIIKKSSISGSAILKEELSAPIKSTAILSENNNTPLKATTVLTNQIPQTTNAFEVEYDITFIHTNDIIT